MATPKPIRPINAHGFRGMNNLPSMPAKLLDDTRRITPHIALNVEVTDGGVLVKRGGFSAVKSLAGLHSLAGEESGLSVMLGVAQGILYRLEGGAATPLGAVSGPRARLTYVEMNGRIYISGPYWKGILDLATMNLGSWGVDLPPAPDITMAPGDLPPGNYSLCFTKVEDGRISGNGPITQVVWEGMAQGIRLNNLPAGGQCWLTHPHGGKLFLAKVVNGVITGQVPQIKPLPTFSVAPPPCFTPFCQAFGRIWGINGRKLHYSDSFQYEWFRAGNYLPFLEDLVMVAPVNEGLFVNSLSSTWFLAGSVPAKMTLTRVGDGAIPGTLTVAQMPGAVAGGGAEASRPLSQLPSPVWLSQNGFVVGTHTGHLTHLTERRLRLTARNQGASLYQVKGGIPQIISSLHGLPAKGEVDEDLEAIFAMGRIFVPEPLSLVGAGGIAIGS